LTVDQAAALVEWVAASGKNLTTIYVTHGQGDHFFGIGALLNHAGRKIVRPRAYAPDPAPWCINKSFCERNIGFVDSPF
jgi:glyoxylase-like metal-dependent hydrolase (beta-lactamase superfamily II)